MRYLFRYKLNPNNPKLLKTIINFVFYTFNYYANLDLNNIEHCEVNQENDIKIIC
jgi:hypothetical protein